ncbi:MAG: glycosyltransferase family 2 protein [Planctomycetota bacterium]|jgi:hypothetical protein
MNSATKTTDVVICHYNREGAPHIRHMALHSAAFLCRERPADLNIVLVDGSRAPDRELARGLEPLGVRYAHLGRELSFAETYNAGIRSSSAPVVVTMANDVLIEAGQVRALAREVGNGVGCALPYLTASDYGAQTARRLRVPRRCFPTRMTLNVNAFAREALERIGLIPDQMTGCYNDVILSIRLHEKGYRVVLRNVGRVIHLGQQTLKTGATNVAYEADARLFAEQYPRYWRGGVVQFHKVAQCRATRWLYRLVESLPAGLVDALGLWNVAWAVEPYLCAEPGTFRQGALRLLGARGAAQQQRAAPSGGPNSQEAAELRRA